MYKSRISFITIISIFLMMLSANFNFSSEMIATASSEESSELCAYNAIDGDMNTRWSSTFDDNQWLLIDLGKVTDLAGLEIYWEDAHAKEYKILLSKSKKIWNEAFHANNCDGGLDDITFKKQSIRYIKILAISRATDWGNSILEIKLKTSMGKTIDKKAKKNILASGKSEAIDDFESIDSWQKINSDDANLELNIEKGKKGNALVMEIDFTKNQGYVVIAKEFSLTLPGNYNFSFFVKGTLPSNNIELKLIDEAGNTYWNVISNYKFSSKWKEININKKDIVFAWGSGGNESISNVEKIEIAISCGNGGQGKVYIDELKLNKSDEGVSSKTSTTSTTSTKQASITASAIQDERHPAEHAFDNNMSTRWSSPFVDPSWLMIDLGEEREVGGLTIFWEAAYGSAYDILLSSDNKNWKNVFSTDDSDGKSDEIFFKKQKARYVKIFGRKRATGWGYSIFEVKIIDPEFIPKISASTNKKKADNVFDGNMKTLWTSKRKNGEVIIDFKKNKRLGGLIIHYQEDSLISNRSIFISDDKAKWEKIYSSKKKANNIDYIYFNVASARYIKIKASCQNKLLSIKDINIKGQDEKATKVKMYEIAALQSPKGFYPLWINNKQEYWTAVGVVDDNIESLVSEMGIVEPKHRSHTFTPILRVDNEIITYENVETIQSLEDDYLPIPRVIWKSEKFDFTIDVFAADESQKSSTYVKYSIINKSSDTFKGEFYLLVRPFQLNPPWMHGGLAGIKSIEYNSKESGMMKINKKEAIFIPFTPDEYGTSEFKNTIGYGDIIDDIYEGKFSGNIEKFIDKTSRGSAALKYKASIEPGNSKSFYFIIPLHKDNEINKELNTSNISEYFSEKREQIKKFWEDKLDNIKIQVPDKEFIDTLKSNIAYILINDDSFRLQPGSRNYESSWMRDGSVTVTALLSMGYKKEVERYLNWITKFIKSDGWVPFIIDNNDKILTHGWKEYDSQGQYIYSILQYYLFTNDKKILSDKKQKIIDVINFIEERRNERKTSKYESSDMREFYGIFPESASHEGYIDPPRHSYWDDFWGLRGMNDAVRIFKILKDNSRADWADNIRKDFQKYVYESIDIVVKKKNINYIPGCAELGDPDPTSTAIGLWPCNEMNNMPQKTMLDTFEMYWNELKKRFKDDWVGVFTPYELRNANAFMLTGQRDKLHKMISKFFEWKRPRAWNHWAEVVTSDYRMPQYLGDMPHTWIGAGYVNVIRNMFIFEDDAKLYLGRGIPVEWVSEGEKISIKDMPTHFGPISYTLESNKDSIEVDIDGDIKKTKKIIFVIPIPAADVKSISINGKKHTKWKNGEIEINRLPAKISIKK